MHRKAGRCDRRPLRGRVAFVCWRGAAENDWMHLPRGAFKGILPPSAPPDPEAPGPFSFGDQARVARILKAAGMTEAAIAPFDASVPFGEALHRTYEPEYEKATAIGIEAVP